MTVESKYFTPEHFAHPERWQFGSYSLAWIAAPEDGTSVAFRCHGESGLRTAKQDYTALSYTPPDPWEGVDLPQLTLGGGMFARWEESGDIEIACRHLPSRRFRLVPVEG